MKCLPTPKLMTLFTRDLSPYLLHLVPYLAFGGEVLPHNTLTFLVIMVYFIIHCFRSKRVKWSWMETFKQWTKKQTLPYHLILSQWQKASWDNKRKYSKDRLGCQPFHNRVHVGVLRAVFTMQSQNQDFSKDLKHPSAVQATTPQSTLVVVLVQVLQVCRMQALRLLLLKFKEKLLESPGRTGLLQRICMGATPTRPMEKGSVLGPQNKKGNQQHPTLEKAAGNSKH